ncbi:MAG TPA: hypothetical protein VJR23_04420 [Candidatus Acidoferrales bacterium]|nr:hypothetical protein [Candidatus Acidoferrales bacterium]
MDSGIAAWLTPRSAVRAGIFFAAALLCTMMAAAQSNTPSSPPAQDKSSAQSQSNADNKPATSGKTDDSKKSDDSGVVKLKIVVVGANEKPVQNASVYVRFDESGGFLHKDKLAEMNFKTNEDGSVKTPEVPQGKILIQVIAKGWHTFGKWYDVEKNEETIQIKLEPPPHWY